MTPVAPHHLRHARLVDGAAARPDSPHPGALS